MSDENKSVVDKLKDEHLDALREIGNIGSGNAASALAQLINRKVDMNLPIVKILDVQELAEALGGAENQVVGILFQLENEFKGMMMFLVAQEFTHLILNVLMGKDFTSFEDLGDMDISAIKEVGNILVGSYIGALSQLTNFKIELSPPAIAIDMVGAILSVPAIEIEKFGDKALFIQDGFIDGAEKVTSYLMLIPEVGYLENMLKMFGMDI